MEEWNSGTMGPVKKEFPPFCFLQYSIIPTFQFLKCSKGRVGG